MSEARDFVGRAVLRREDAHLLRGEGRFIDDVPEPDGTLHLGLVLARTPTPGSLPSTRTGRLPFPVSTRCSPARILRPM